jgi:hypothetical protein
MVIVRGCPVRIGVKQAASTHHADINIKKRFIGGSSCIMAQDTEISMILKVLPVKKSQQAQ